MTPDSTAPAGLAPAPEPAPQPAFAFTGRRGPLLRLLLKNLALTLVTLGIYRFWAKTAVRRYFWSHTTILDDPLEYTGTGKELLLGFLVALLFLVPLGLTYAAIDILVAPVLTPARIALEVGYYLLLLFLIQIAVYRIWRYRLSRTLWRGIRFGLDGSSLGYAALSMGWLFLTAVTLGLAYPWRSLALWRYRLAHSRFGSTPFCFEATALRLLPYWVMCLLVPAAGIGTFAAAMRFAPQIESNGVVLALMLTGALVTVAGGSLCLVLYRVGEARLVINGTALGDVRFTSRLGAGAIVGAAALVLAIFLAFASAAMTPAILDMIDVFERTKGNAVPAQLVNASILLSIVVIVGITVVLPLLNTVIVQVTVLDRLTATATVDQPAVLEQTVQATERGPAHGEGLADAFDVGAI